MFNNMLERSLATTLEEIRKTRKVFFKKIEIPKLVQMLCYLVTNNSPSYRDIALEYYVTYKKRISKQAFYYLFENHLLTILLEVIQLVLLKTEKDSLDNIPNYFNRILLQDSVAIKLPRKAHDKFSGMANKKGCKIQATFDVISNSFPNLAITPFTVNDQRYSYEIKNNITKNDLIIRDLGYFTTDSLMLIHSKGAFFLNKIRVDTKIFNKAGKEIDLLKYLNLKGEIDEVLYVTMKKMPVRVVAKRVSEEKANRRRHVKKKERKSNPSKKSLALLSWDIIITNIFDKAVESETLLSLYRLRWKIEIIFKTWKSHCQIHNFHEGISDKQTLIYLTIRLLTIIITNDISSRLMPYAKHKKDNHKLSYLSLMKHLLRKVERIIYVECRDSLIQLMREIIPYSYYEKRNRVTLLDIELSILQDLSYTNKTCFVP